jgi:hypothetical protein
MTQTGDEPAVDEEKKAEQSKRAAIFRCAPRLMSLLDTIAKPTHSFACSQPDPRRIPVLSE